MSYRIKDVSTRLIKPTLQHIPIKELYEIISKWCDEWEHDGSVSIFDEGIAQYLLTDMLSHLKFYGALFLDKPSLKCRLVPESEAPLDVLEEEYENHITFVYNGTGSIDEIKIIEKIKFVLKKRGFRFTN
uniref:DUF2656 domain-containing protein n=1 Tax=Strongyloides stercoralis TaxID=6248 RepID=A0A0K0E4V1_STRER